MDDQSNRLAAALQSHRNRRMLPVGGKSRLRSYLQRWTPLNASPRGYWWQTEYGVVFVSFWAISQGLGGSGALASLSLPIRFLWLFFLGIFCSTTLSVQGLHWRRWLLPGAPLRNRIGSELFGSTAKMYLIALPPLAALSALVAWESGMSPHDVGVHAVRGLTTIAELAFAIAAADALAAVLKGRVHKLRASLFDRLPHGEGLVIVRGFALRDR